ncbi:MAG: site-specific integrase [Bacteroidetes bacterium]|nr:site-specific integrase [Bacteroidota bacterium]
MASIKILLRTAKQKKNGESPIVLRTIKDKKASFSFTGYYCKPEFWDAKNEQPNKKHPNQFELRFYLTKLKNDAEKAVLGLESKDTGYSANQLKKVIKGSSKKITVFQFIDEITAGLESINRIGNANAYKDCKRALSKYRNGQDLSFRDIDESFLKKYEGSFLSRGVSTNSISVYMRTLRAVFNQAIQEGYCDKQYYPFNEYKISKLDTTTIKRALTKEQMNKIIALKIKAGTHEYDSKNYFLFSFYTRGMNFTDMAKLKWSDIKKERLIYTRSKTRKNFDLEVLAPAIKILNYYKPFTGASVENYVFPILSNEKHITATQIDNRIEKLNKATNKDLKVIATNAKIDFNLTTYVARHSFATILKRNGQSTSIISELLGHDSEKTTQIYLDSFGNKELDKASRNILI